MNLFTAYLRERSYGYRATEAHRRARNNWAAFLDARAAHEDAAVARDHAADKHEAEVILCARLRELTAARQKCARPYRDARVELRHETKVGPEWYDNPEGASYRDGTGLIWGVIGQLPARKGRARFVAGYEHGGTDGGPFFDLTRIFTDGDIEGEARDAATVAAGHMAEEAADSERVYRTAYDAGVYWRQTMDSIQGARHEVREILAERRALRGKSGYPVLCRAIRERVATLLEDISRARDRARLLRDGDGVGYCFWPGDARLREAFCEGAGLSEYPQ